MFYSRLKKSSSTRNHFQSIVHKRSKARSVNMDGAHFLQMVLEYLQKNQV